MTPLKVALFGACADSAFQLAESLNRALAESGIKARVGAFDAAAANVDIPAFDAIFLMGYLRSGKADLSRQAADESIRAALRQAEVRYEVIYGSDEESLAQMVRAMEKLSKAPPIPAVPSKQNDRGSEAASPWTWLCDKCSDPQCEHRSLTDLLKQRRTGFSI